MTQLFGLNFYTGQWLRGYGVGTPNGVLWTIGVQIQFFLMVPVLYRVLKKLKLSGSMILPVFVLWKIGENTMQIPHFLDGVMYNTVTTLLTAMLIFAFTFRFQWRMRKDLTYGFYLYYMVFINVAVHQGHKTLEFNWQSTIVVLVVTVLPVLVAWLSQNLIEDPVAKLYKKKEGT